MVPSSSVSVPVVVVVAVLALAVASSYLTLGGSLFATRTYTYELQFHFQGVEPKALWHHFADFENVAKSNPTIVDYKILRSTKTINSNRSTSDESDDSRDEPFEYSVECTETLVHLPFLTNVGLANYSVGTSIDPSAPRQPVYWINSTHVTYQNGGAFHSTDEIKFSQGPSGPSFKSTSLQQTIVIECPLLLAPFCRYELEGQRTLILKTLRKEFQFSVKFMAHINIKWDEGSS